MKVSHTTYLTNNPVLYSCLSPSVCLVCLSLCLLSCLVLSCLVLSCLVLSCLVLSVCLVCLSLCLFLYRLGTSLKVSNTYYVSHTTYLLTIQFFIPVCLSTSTTTTTNFYYCTNTVDRHGSTLIPYTKLPKTNSPAPLRINNTSVHTPYPY